MHNLLVINFSSRKNSVSTALSDEFVKMWISANQGANIVRKDLGLTPPIGPNDDWIKANMMPEEQRTPTQVELLSSSDDAITSLHQASHIVISTPMFNFSIPWGLKAYIDLIVRIEKTFSLDSEKGLIPLLNNNKKLLVIWTSAFDYSPQTSGESMDFLTPYLKFVFGFLGITQIEFIHSGNQWSSKKNAEDSIAKAHKQLYDLSYKW